MGVKITSTEPDTGVVMMRRGFTTLKKVLEMFNMHIIKAKEVKPCSEFESIAFSQCVMSMIYLFIYFFLKYEESFVLLGVKLLKVEAEQN